MTTIELFIRAYCYHILVCFRDIQSSWMKFIICVFVPCWWIHVHGGFLYRSYIYCTFAMALSTTKHDPVSRRSIYVFVSYDERGYYCVKFRRTKLSATTTTTTEDINVSSVSKEWNCSPRQNWRSTEKEHIKNKCLLAQYTDKRREHTW